MRFIQAQDIKSHFNMAIVINHDFTSELAEKTAEHIINRLKELDFNEDNITMVMVPSILDFALAARKLAMTSDYAAIIAFGFYDPTQLEEYKAVLNSCTHDIESSPILFQGFLLDDEKEAVFHDHLSHAARELGERAYEMVSIIRQIG
jgi:6,7-dimethyl-8-ribityllumazine synthase